MRLDRRRLPGREAAVAGGNGAGVAEIAGIVDDGARLRREGARQAARWVSIGVLAVLVPVFVGGLNDYLVTLAIQAAVTGVVLLSAGIVTERAGMLAVCPMSFAAIGAWSVGFFNVHGVPGGFFVWTFLAGVVAMPFGLLVGLPALRLRGVNLAVVTLSFAVALDSVFNLWQFPGTLTSQFVQRPAAVESDNSYFAFCWAVFVALAIVIWWIGRRPFGTSWRCVARSERATAAMGLSVPRTKLGVFLLGAFIAGVSGALLVGQISTAVEDSFSPTASLTIFAVAIMAGAGYPEGAAIGGILSAFFPALLQDVGLPPDLGSILFAVGAVHVLSVGTSMTGAWRQTGRKLLRRRHAKRQGAPRAATPAAVAARTGGSVVREPAPRSRGAAVVLAAKGLTVRYGNVVALDNLSIELAAESVGGLIGPNGAGKSTFVDAVSGFIRGYAGTISLDGTVIDELVVHQRVRAGVRRTFQQERTVPALRVEDYVRLAARRRITRTEIGQALAFVGGPDQSAMIAEVDVGSRRLVEFAGCLAARPRVLLLDEPTAGLAEAESLLVAERIAQIPEQFGSSVLLIEHDMSVVSAACSQITVLDFGREIARGTPAEVLKHADVVSAYLGDLALVGT